MRWFRSVICELSYHISTGVYRVGYARRGMLGRGRWLGYSTLMIHSYIVRDYSFSLPSFSRKGASFVCHTNCSNGVIRAHCMNT